MPDTIMREIRQTRDELAKRFHFDMHELCLELRREQEIGLAPVVTFAAEPSSTGIGVLEVAVNKPTPVVATTGLSVDD